MEGATNEYEIEAVSEEEILRSTEDTSTKEELAELDNLALQYLIYDDCFLKKLVSLNDTAVARIKSGKHKEALFTLAKAEKILEFAANCGKAIDRNLIIVVLYNRACSYQGIWILDKCYKYIDGVIYNLEMGLSEEEELYDYVSYDAHSAQSYSQSMQRSLRSRLHARYNYGYRIRKQTFLVRSYLYYCAILSYLGSHEQALYTSVKCTHLLYKIFRESLEVCRECMREALPTQYSNSRLRSYNPYVQTYKKPYASNSQQPQPYHYHNHHHHNHHHQNHLQQLQHISKYSFENQIDNLFKNNSSKRSLQSPPPGVKEEVQFARYILEYALSTLADIVQLPSIDYQLAAECNTLDSFLETKKSLYFWKNNPENNEKHIRQELNVPARPGESETRGLLGVYNGYEWIEHFNIGTIMHMYALSYEDFNYYSDFVFEMQKKHLLERIIFLSICYFTIATETRFLEIEKYKNSNPERILESLGYKQSEIFHLKAIYVVCKHITCKSPFINHLITSYHKHYNQNLETIQEEMSVFSQSVVERAEGSPKNRREDYNAPKPTTNVSTAVCSVDLLFANDMLVAHRSLPANGAYKNETVAEEYENLIYDDDEFFKPSTPKQESTSESNDMNLFINAPLENLGKAKNRVNAVYVSPFLQRKRASPLHSVGTHRSQPRQRYAYRDQEAEDQYYTFLSAVNLQLYQQPETSSPENGELAYSSEIVYPVHKRLEYDENYYAALAVEKEAYAIGNGSSAKSAKKKVYKMKLNLYMNFLCEYSKGRYSHSAKNTPRQALLEEDQRPKTVRGQERPEEQFLVLRSKLSTSQSPQHTYFRDDSRVKISIKKKKHQFRNGKKKGILNSIAENKKGVAGYKKPQSINTNLRRDANGNNKISSPPSYLYTQKSQSQTTHDFNRFFSQITQQRFSKNSEKSTTKRTYIDVKLYLNGAGKVPSNKYYQGGAKNGRKNSQLYTPADSVSNALSSQPSQANHVYKKERGNDVFETEHEIVYDNSLLISKYHAAYPNTDDENFNVPGSSDYRLIYYLKSTIYKSHMNKAITNFMKKLDRYHQQSCVYLKKPSTSPAQRQSLLASKKERYYTHYKNYLALNGIETVPSQEKSKTPLSHDKRPQNGIKKNTSKLNLQLSERVKNDSKIFSPRDKGLSMKQGNYKLF